MTFLEYVQNNIHRVAKPFRTRFKYDSAEYGTYREYWTTCLLMGSVALNLLLILL